MDHFNLDQVTAQIDVVIAERKHIQRSFEEAKLEKADLAIRVANNQAHFARLAKRTYENGERIEELGRKLHKMELQARKLPPIGRNEAPCVTRPRPIALKLPPL